MNDPRNRKRILWIGILGGVLLLSLLFVSLFAPSTEGSSTTPVVRPPVQDAGQASGATGEPSPGFSLSGGEALSLMWRLGLVAAVIGVSIVGLRWWGKRSVGPKSASGFLRVVDTLTIGNGRAIHLVALGDRVIAVGAAAQQLTLLNELRDDEAREVLAAVPQQGQPALAGFAAELLHSMRRPERPDAPTRNAVIENDRR